MRIATLSVLRYGASSFFAAAVIVLTAGASCVSAQVPSKRHVDVTVTDPQGRFVTGLEQRHFEVIENDVRRAIADFSDGGSPIALAVVSEAPLSAAGVLGPEDELIQTPSLSSALRQLAASKNSRKAILMAATTDVQTIPSGIQILQANPANLAKAVIELRSQYRLEFESSTPSAGVEVVLNQPRGLPPLKLNWK